MVGDFLDAPKDPQPFVGMSPAPFYYGYSSIYQSWGEDVENGILCMSLARALDRWPADLKTMCANIRSARRNNATTIKVSLRVRDAAALEAFVHEFGPASRDVPHKLVAATLSAAAEISADKPWPVEVMLNSAAAREAGVERLDDADATRFITLTSGELAGFARADDVVEEILEQSEGRTEDERPVSL